jgi:hypothetical protein
MQLYRYFVSQSSEFCRHNPLRCFSTSVNCSCCLFIYRLSPETFGHTLVNWGKEVSVSLTPILYTSRTLFYAPTSLFRTPYVNFNENSRLALRVVFVHVISSLVQILSYWWLGSPTGNYLRLPSRTQVLPTPPTLIYRASLSLPCYWGHFPAPKILFHVSTYSMHYVLYTEFRFETQAKNKIRN